MLTGCQSVETTIPLVTETAASAFEGGPVPTELPPPTETPAVTHIATSMPSLTASPTKTMTPTPSPSPTLAPGATQISAVDGAVLIYIPAGEFPMGSLDTDSGADADEFPQHPVYLADFWIDQTVVTNAMYAAFLNTNGNQVEGRATWLDAADEDVLLLEADGRWHAKPGYENYPAVEVSWYGAQAYCQWAGRRLPTEAEWEKAARGQDGRTYPWGEDIDCEKAEYANCGGGLQAVDQNPSGASPYGVLGLSGNVWEWVGDWYAPDYYAASHDRNPTGPRDGDAKVLRGGGWEYDWKHIRAANRRHNGPAVTMHDYGFRCVLGVSDE